jgi:hypothetical protein
MKWPYERDDHKKGCRKIEVERRDGSQGCHAWHSRFSLPSKDVSKNFPIWLDRLAGL